MLVLISSALAFTPVVDLGTYGRYTNVIQPIAPTAAYAEVCFVGGLELVDLHPAGGPTAGGNCVPGNLGFVVETVERPARRWASALASCISVGMRLPTPFEVLYVEEYVATLGMADPATFRTWVGDPAHVDPAHLPGNVQPVVLRADTTVGTGWSLFDPTVNAPTTSPYLCAQ